MNGIAQVIVCLMLNCTTTVNLKVIMKWKVKFMIVWISWWQTLMRWTRSIFRLIVLRVMLFIYSWIWVVVHQIMNLIGVLLRE